MRSALSKLWSHLRTNLGLRAAEAPGSHLRPTDIINVLDEEDLHRWASQFGVSAAELREVLLASDQRRAPLELTDMK